jgi:hypothetical protein
VLAGVQPALAEFMGEIQAQIDAITEPTEVLRNFGIKLADLCTAAPDSMAIVVSELATLDLDRLTLAMRYLPDFYGPLRTVMTLARAQGKLRPEIGVELATDFFLSSVLNLVRAQFAAGRLDRLGPMLSATMEIFLYGAFCVPAGGATNHQE